MTGLPLPLVNFLTGPSPLPSSAIKEANYVHKPATRQHPDRNFSTVVTGRIHPFVIGCRRRRLGRRHGKTAKPLIRFQVSPAGACHSFPDDAARWTSLRTMPATTKEQRPALASVHRLTFPSQPFPPGCARCAWPDTAPRPPPSTRPSRFRHCPASGPRQGTG